MLGKKKFLALLLSSLVLVGGGRALAIGPRLIEDVAPPPAGAETPKDVKAPAESSSPAVRKKASLPAPGPAAVTRKPARKSAVFKAQAPAAPRMRARPVRGGDARSQSAREYPRKAGRSEYLLGGKKSAGVQDQAPVAVKSKLSKPAVKSAAVQDQAPARSKLKVAKVIEGAEEAAK